MVLFTIALSETDGNNEDGGEPIFCELQKKWLKNTIVLGSSDSKEKIIVDLIDAYNKDTPVALHSVLKKLCNLRQVLLYRFFVL